MLRVGLTGGIGSGKSTVTSLLRELGAVVTDADQAAREVVAAGRPALAAIAAQFGPGVIRADGTLDRAALAAVVFPDPARLAALEAITDPAIADHVRVLRAAVPRDRVDVYDMPLLVERGTWVHEHLTLVVGASERVRLDRLVTQRGMPLDDARARIAAQAGDDQRRAAADLWVDNEGSREDTAEQVRRLWRDRLVPFDENLRRGIRSARTVGARIVAADPSWAAQGARVVARIAAALAGRGVHVEHVGSTSVPGLAAKDVVDIQVGVLRMTDAQAPGFAEALAHAGYLRVFGHDVDHVDADHFRPLPKHFYGGCDPSRVVNVHVRETGSLQYRAALLLRDWLRAQPDERDGYAAHKRALADRTATTAHYAAAKDPWFREAFPRALDWARSSGWSAD